MSQYETLSKYQTNEGLFQNIESFLEWLEEERSISLQHWDRHNNPPVNVQDLLFEWEGIDKTQLEKERKELLAEQRALII